MPSGGCGRPGLGEEYERWKAGHDSKGAAPSGRGLKEFMGTRAASEAAVWPNMSRVRVRGAIVDDLRARGMTGRDFATLACGEQNRLLVAAMEKEQHFKTAAIWREFERMAVVNMGKVRGKSYLRNLREVFGDDMAPLAHEDLALFVEEPRFVLSLYGEYGG